ncbi:hypothetical protein ABZT04_27260 [Streptomyces sp. NPDC005492]
MEQSARSSAFSGTTDRTCPAGLAAGGDGIALLGPLILALRLVADWRAA